MFPSWFIQEMKLDEATKKDTFGSKFNINLKRVYIASLLFAKPGEKYSKRFSIKLLLFFLIYIPELLKLQRKT
jgi:hypothetical protein